MRKAAKLILCIILGSVIGLAFNLAVNSFSPPKQKVITESFGLKMKDSRGEEVTSFFLDLKDRDEFNYTVVFTNESRQNENFSLYLLLDYVKIPFHAGTALSMPVNEYKFNVAKGASAEIPVRFPITSLPPNLHALAINIVANKENPSEKEEKIKDYFGIVARYALKKTGNSVFALSTAPDQHSYEIANMPVRGIMLNQQFENEDNFGTLPKIIRAKPNESIKLAVRAGGFKNTKDYLVWLMMDDRQLPFPDGKPYWWFEAPPEKAALRQIEFNAPEKPGRYEVYGYVMNSPWDTMTELAGKEIGNRSSHKITLLVE
ncbi:hypothetical protein [Paenibacillus oleatilyticus]|uniref:DUF916 domain-containing protein n=1 Tax=Paenibacillus oleatilyticus TaxID=2594886 RepID=A0ABV4UWR0_9BACL